MRALWLTPSRIHPPPTDSFLFVYVLNLIDDLEDPFEYHIYSLMPHLQPEGGRMSMHSTGSADVDVFPLLELYARLASLAGLKDIVGASGGLEAQYTVIGRNGELRAPSEVVDEVDAVYMRAETVATRDHYRQTLMDATYSALRFVDKERGTLGKGASGGGESPLPSHSVNFITNDGGEIKRGVRENLLGARGE